MSDNTTKIIPKEANQIPHPSKVRECVQMLSTLLSLEKTPKVTEFDTLIFHDCGQNFENIICPNCNSKIDFDSWHEWMGIFTENPITLKSFTLPCCNTICDLNNLIYEEPQGFSKFVIELYDSDFESVIDKLSVIQEKLDCEIRLISSHI